MVSTKEAVETFTSILKELGAPYFLAEFDGIVDENVVKKVCREGLSRAKGKEIRELMIFPINTRVFYIPDREEDPPEPPSETLRRILDEMERKLDIVEKHLSRR